MQPIVKIHQIYYLRECSLFYRLRGNIHFWSKELLSKRRILVIKESILVKFIGQISFIEFKRVFLSLVK